MNRKQIKRLAVSDSTKAALLAVHRQPSEKNKHDRLKANLSELISSTGYVARRADAPTQND